MNSLENLLRRFLEELASTVKSQGGALENLTPSAARELGPVNGALGDTIGKIVNGKKSFVGILGALFSSLLGNANPESVTGQIGAILTKAMPLFAGSSGTFLPIFLAILAWGVMGKFEKWSGHSK